MSKSNREWRAPAVVAVTTFVVFLPVLSNGFLAWDDNRDLLDNAYWRGLAWSNIRWAFTLHNQHYIPLTWLSFGLDYLVWGMNPTGYHLTNLLNRLRRSRFLGSRYWLYRASCHLHYRSTVMRASSGITGCLRPSVMA